MVRTLFVAALITLSSIVSAQEKPVEIPKLTELAAAEVETLTAQVLAFNRAIEAIKNAAVQQALQNDKALAAEQQALGSKYASVITKVAKELGCDLETQVVNLQALTCQDQQPSAVPTP